MREVTFESCHLEYGVDIKMPDLNTMLWLKSSINVLALLAMGHISNTFIEPGSIKVIPFNAEKSDQFIHFLNKHEHVGVCPRILKKLSEIFEYSFEILEFKEDLIVRSDTFNVGVLAALKAFFDCKVYFTNKFISFHSTSLN